MAARPIFYDTETTGLYAEKDRIVEIAAYDPFNDKTFVQLINPQISIPAEATAIHRITDEMVAEAPAFAAIASQFQDFCGEDAFLIAHNNDAFDIHFLRAEYKRSNMALPSWKFIDSLKWARRYRRDLPRHTLQFMREMFGIAANNAHRALDDVIVLYQVFTQLIDDLSIEQVYNLMNQERAMTHMPFGKHQGTPLNKLPGDYVAWLKKSGALDKNENSSLKQALEKLGK